MIETERLCIRLMRWEDTDELLGIFGDPKVMAAFGVPPFERPQLERWVRRNLEHQERYGYGLFSVVLKADGLIVATPVYKASYTGLLKAFLDLYGPDGLAGAVVVPLVVSGNPAHALVGEVHLRPVLVELGAVVPTRSLTVTEPQLADLGPVVDAWLARQGDALRRATAPLPPAEDRPAARTDAAVADAFAGVAR